MGPLFSVACAALVATVAPADVDAQPLVLGTGLADDEALRSELALRLPGHAILPPQERGRLPSAFLWIVADVPTQGAFELQIITADGRLYRRRVALPTDGDAARVTAGAIANLVDGIARETLTPDETEVPIPVVEVTQPQRVEEPLSRSQPEPDVMQTTPTPPPPAPDPPKTYLTVGGTGVLGVGPPSSLAGFVGGGASVGVLWWAHSQGPMVGGRLRGIGRRRSGLSVGRVQVWLQLGYARSFGRWSVVTSAGPLVEPVWFDDTVRETNGRRRRGVPLVGFAAAAGPRWKVWERSDGMSLWLAADLDASASVEARRPMGVVLVRDAESGQPLLRAGGVELAPTLGVEVRL